MHKHFCATMKQPFLAVLALLTLCEHWAAAEPQASDISSNIWAFYSVADWETWTRTGQQKCPAAAMKWIYTTFYFRGTREWRQPGGRESKHLYSWKHPETTKQRFPCFTSSLILVQWLFSSPVNHVSYLGCDNAKTIHVHQIKKEPQYIVRFISTYLIPEGKMWEDGKRCQYEEPRR